MYGWSDDDDYSYDGGGVAPTMTDYMDSSGRLLGKETDAIKRVQQQIKQTNNPETTLKVLFSLVRFPVSSILELTKRFQTLSDPNGFQRLLGAGHSSVKHGVPGFISPKKITAAIQEKVLEEYGIGWRSPVHESLVYAQWSVYNIKRTMRGIEKKASGRYERLSKTKYKFEENIKRLSNMIKGDQLSSKVYAAKESALNKEDAAHFFEPMQVQQLQMIGILFDIPVERWLEKSPSSIAAMVVMAVALQFEKLPEGVRRNSTTLFRYGDAMINYAHQVLTQRTETPVELMEVMSNLGEQLFALTKQTKALSLIDPAVFQKRFDAAFAKAQTVAAEVQKMVDDGLVRPNFRTCLAVGESGQVEIYNKKVWLLETLRKEMLKFCPYVEQDKRIETVISMPPAVRMLDLPYYSWAEFLYLDMCQHYGNSKLPTTYAVILGKGPADWSRDKLVEFLQAVKIKRGTTVPAYLFENHRKIDVSFDRARHVDLERARASITGLMGLLGIKGRDFYQQVILPAAGGGGIKPHKAPDNPLVRNAHAEPASKPAPGV